MTDSFVSCSEDKWVRSSGLVLLLPHGYDGQGPDHSSARVERFLQLCAESPDPPLPLLLGTPPDGSDIHNDETQHPTDTNRAALDDATATGAGSSTSGASGSGSATSSSSSSRVESMALATANMHVINATTPAQYFHLLRRHMLLPVRKPLVVFTPKYLLHHKRCSSALEDFGPDQRFHTVLADPLFDNNGYIGHGGGGDISRTGGGGIVDHRASGGLPKRVLLCSGKMYYHLSQRRKQLGLEDSVAIVRIEQLSPFPFHSLANTLAPLLLPASIQGQASTADTTRCNGEVFGSQGLAGSTRFTQPGEQGETTESAGYRDTGPEVLWVQEEPANMGW